MAEQNIHIFYMVTLGMILQVTCSSALAITDTFHESGTSQYRNPAPIDNLKLNQNSAAKIPFLQKIWRLSLKDCSWLKIQNFDLVEERIPQTYYLCKNLPDEEYQKTKRGGKSHKTDGRIRLLKNMQ